MIRSLREGKNFFLTCHRRLIVEKIDFIMIAAAIDYAKHSQAMNTRDEAVSRTWLVREAAEWLVGSDGRARLVVNEEK